MANWLKKICSDKTILGFLLLFNLLMATVFSLKFYYLYTSTSQPFGVLYKAPWYYNSRIYFTWYMSLSASLFLITDIIAGYFMWQHDISKSLKIAAVPMGLLIIKMFV